MMSTIQQIQTQQFDFVEHTEHNMANLIEEMEEVWVGIGDLLEYM